jgi:hypothetical protein
MVCGGACTFADAIGDFRDFENGIDFGLDAFQFAGAVKSRNPLAEVVKRQVGSPGTNDYTELAATVLA